MEAWYANDGGLVCEQLGGLFREPRCQDGRHQGEFLHPRGDILDRRACRERRLPETQSRELIQGDVRHLHELQVQDLLDQLGRQEGHRVERASALQPRGRVSSDLTGGFHTGARSCQGGGGHRGEEAESVRDTCSWREHWQCCW